MGEGRILSGSPSCSETCVAIALAVCAVVEYLSVWGGKDIDVPATAF